AAAAGADAEPPVRALRTQRVGDVVYFHVRLDLPADAARPAALRASADWPEAALRGLGRLPRLVPQDGRARAVYLRAEVTEAGAAARPAARGGLEFLGRLAADAQPGPSRFLLLSPTGNGPAAP